MTDLDTLARQLAEQVHALVYGPPDPEMDPERRDEPQDPAAKPTKTTDR